MRILLPIFFISFFSFATTAQDFYDIDQVQEIRITFAEENWEEILDSLKREGKKNRLVGDVKINGKDYPKCGIRHKGNSSFYSTSKAEEKKLPFNIKLTYTDKEQKTPEGYKTLKLSNVFRDPSFVREALSYEIARDYMPASKCNFAKLYINNQYWGLYNNSQSVDGKFLEEYYGDKEGTFFKCDPPDWQADVKSNCEKSDKASLMYVGDNVLCYQNFYELKSDSAIGWKYLIDLTKALQKPDKELEEMLDIDQILWMLAFDNVLVNLDSYTGRLCHNYYLYRDDSDQFHPVIWDLNMSFGGFRFLDEGKQLTNEQLQTISPFAHYKEKNEKRPLITNLLNEPLYRKIYTAHIKTILEEHFSNDAYKKRAKAIQAQVDELVKEDPNKLYSYEDFHTNLDTTVMLGRSKMIGVVELMEKRTAYLNNHPLIKKETPEFIGVEYEEQDTAISITTTTTSIEQCWLFYRYGESDFFHRVAMTKDGEQENEGVQEVNWLYEVPKQAGLQYYLVAEDKKTASLSPKKAAHEFHEVIVKEMDTASTGE
ncbi:MAG: CotH kinase family protein [Bacteroidota bacterium]